MSVFYVIWLQSSAPVRAHTIKLLKIWTPKQITVITLKFEKSGFTVEYRKFPKYSDTQKFCCNHSKIWTMWLYHRVMSPNDADGMANSVDPDRTALGAVWSDLGLHCSPGISIRKLRIITVMHPKDADWVANSVNPDQEQSDLGLHCLPRPIGPKN